MIRALAAVATLLGGCATVGEEAAASAEPVIAAERAFAADAAVRGTKAAIAASAAADAVMVRKGEAVNARAFVASWPERKDAGELKWWPVLAGVSRAGDLGFTTGPAQHGDGGFTHYFTVWRREPDGAWRWVIDMGSRAPLKTAEAPDTPVRVVPPGRASRSGATGALAEVRALEAAMTAEMASDYAAAHRRRLAPDARVFGMQAAPATGEAAVAAALAARPKAIASRPLGGGAARSGDLAYTYGVAEWQTVGKAARGSYMRVWQRRPQGWRIVADLISGD